MLFVKQEILRAMAKPYLEQWSFVDKKTVTITLEFQHSIRFGHQHSRFIHLPTMAQSDTTGSMYQSSRSTTKQHHTKVLLLEKANDEVWPSQQLFREYH